MKTWRQVAGLAVVAALAGCATGGVDVAEQGAAPALASGLALAGTTEAGAGTALISKLREQGVDTARAEAPLLLEIASGERPWPVGAYSGNSAPEEPAAWLSPPRPRPWWAPKSARICTLEARVIAAADGHEAYRVRASALGRGEGCGRSEALVAAVAASLAGSGAGGR